MSVRNRAIPLVVSVAGMLMGGSPGIRPRGDAADYPVRQSTAAFTVGAALIPRAEVKKIFAADLNSGGYVVVEVGVFPTPGREIDLSPGDFMLLIDTGRTAVRPVDSDAIAAAIAREHKTSHPGESEVYTTADVSISRIPTVDPASGRQGHSTVIGTGAGAGVGPAPYPAPSAGPNVGAMEQELWAKSLPEGKTAIAVAGYLYFPKPSGKAKDRAFGLMMDNAAGRVKVGLLK